MSKKRGAVLLHIRFTVKTWRSSGFKTLTRHSTFDVQNVTVSLVKVMLILKPDLFKLVPMCNIHTHYKE